MKLKVGLIGAGSISGGHLSALSQMKDVEIVGICDIKEENAREKVEKYGGKVYLDYEEMLKKEKLSAIWLCTRPDVRLGPIEAAAKRGIPIFTEKPVSDSVETAKKVCKIVQKYKANVSVGYVFRHLVIVRKLKEYLRKDPITIVSSIYACPMTLCFMEGKPIGGWYYIKKLSGGALVDQATHSLDLLRYIVGDVKLASSFGVNQRQKKTKDYTVEDAYGVNLLFENGVVGSHLHTWLHGVWRGVMKFYCKNGVYDLNLFDRILSCKFQGKEIIHNPPSDMMKDEDRNFLEMVKKNDFSGNFSTYEDATKTLELTLACLKSSDNCRIERLSLI